MNLRDLGILQERVYRCRIRDVDHLKEHQLKNVFFTLITALLIELSISDRSDCEGVSVRTEDTFDINFKRWDFYHCLGCQQLRSG